jgi:hypothetical protein
MEATSADLKTEVMVLLLLLLTSPRAPLYTAVADKSKELPLVILLPQLLAALLNAPPNGAEAAAAAGAEVMLPAACSNASSLCSKVFCTTHALRASFP